MRLQELYDKRAKLVADQRALLDKAEADKRELTSEENESFQKMERDYATADNEIRRGVELEKREAEERKALSIAPTKVETRTDEKRSELRRKAFVTLLRTGNDAELRAVTDPQSLTDADGGTTAPDEFRAELIKELENENVMRRLCRVITSKSGTLTVPKNTAHGSAAYFDELAEITVSKETFGKVTFSAFKAGSLIKISNELLNDSAFDLETFCAEEFARRLGVFEEGKFIAGVGTTEPLGIADATNGAAVGVTAAATTAITTDELFNAYHALKRAYRGRATWLMADSTALLMRKLKDGQQQYMWQPGLVAGQPDVLLGRPVEISDGMPAATAGNKAIVFGDFMRGYWIVERKAIGVRRLSELYAVNDMTGFIAILRHDGGIVDTAALTSLKMHA